MCSVYCSCSAHSRWGSIAHLTYLTYLTYLTHLTSQARITLGLFIVSVAILPREIRAAAPPNDLFSNRRAITGTNLTVTGSNVQASKEIGEPDHAGNVGGRSVWWSWSAPTNGDVTITTDDSTHTDGSPLDTLLGVYTGTNVSTLSLVASNDDHSVVVTSRVRFQAVKNTTYQIAVDGFNDGSGADSGNISLNLVFISEPIPRPKNVKMSP